MSLQHPLSKRPAIPPQHSGTNTRLHGRRLSLARALWVLVLIFSIGLFVTSSVLYARLLGDPYAFVQTHLRHLDPYASGYIAFNARLALLFGDSIGLIILLLSISSVIWIIVGVVIFWRKSNDWMILLASLGLIAMGVTLAPQLSIMYLLANQHAALRVLITLVNVLGWGAVGLLAYLFPNGRFVPRWTAWAALFYLLWQVPQSVPTNSPISIEQWPPLLLACVQFGVLFCPIYAQLYRYRHFSNAVERQQTKWVVFGLVLTLLAEGVIFLPPLFFPTLVQSGPPRLLYVLISACLFPLLLNLIPITIGIAVLRYRLWDVDALINRTLVYSLLTILLVLMYLGLVIVLQMLLHAFFRQANSVVLVASTLAIASVFQPLRRRIQSGIDRRFYRRKYNAAHTLADFSARLRSHDDIDLATLTDDLLKVVVETMQPAHVSLWLRSPERSNGRTTRQLPGIHEEERRTS